MWVEERKERMLCAQRGGGAEEHTPAHTRTLSVSVSVSVSVSLSLSLSLSRSLRTPALTALDVQKERGGTGPVTPDLIREALRRIKNTGVLPPTQYNFDRLLDQ